jgi:hypothetical protein
MAENSALVRSSGSWIPPTHSQIYYTASSENSHERNIDQAAIQNAPSHIHVHDGDTHSRKSISSLQNDRLSPANQCQYPEGSPYGAGQYVDGSPHGAGQYVDGFPCGAGQYVQAVENPSFFSEAEFVELEDRCEEAQSWYEWMSPDETRNFKEEISWAEKECYRDSLKTHFQGKKTFHLKTAEAWMSFMDTLQVPLHPVYALTMHSLCTRYRYPSTLCMHSQCTRYVLATGTPPPCVCTHNALDMHSLCTHYRYPSTLCMHSLCTHTMHSRYVLATGTPPPCLCTHNALAIYSQCTRPSCLCTHYALAIYSQCTRPPCLCTRYALAM